MVFYIKLNVPNNYELIDCYTRKRLLVGRGETGRERAMVSLEDIDELTF